MLEKFWNNVNFLIKAQNKTQRSLSFECDFTERRIESLSSNNRSPDIIEAYKIATALNTTVEFLITGENKTLPEDISEVITLLNTLTINEREPIIDIIKGQVSYWKGKR